MKRYPVSAEEKLGFDVIRAELERYVIGALGQRRLARMIPSNQLTWVRNELGRVAELQDAFRFDDSVPLEPILDLDDVLRRAAPEGSCVSTDDLLAVLLVSTTARRLNDYIMERADKYPLMARCLKPVTSIPKLEREIATVVDEDGRLRDDATPELRSIRRLIGRRQAQLRESVQRALRDAIGRGFATEEQPTIRDGRMVIPVRAEARRKVQGFVHDTSATGQTVYIEPAESLDLNNEVRALEGEERREIERILRLATGKVRHYLSVLRANQDVLADIDLLQAKARLGNVLDAFVPELNEEGDIDVRNGRNPVLILHFSRHQEKGSARAVVPLSLAIGEEYRTLVITGPNAGGKSVAMKTIGLFALMIAYGIPLPVAPGSGFALFGHLIVDIGDEQSIEEDLSTFSSHVANLKYMLSNAVANTLVLIDEAGTGTDPAEGGALSQAVLEFLTRSGARTIATTHHGTLKVFAHETESVENGSMQFDQDTLTPTYVFQSGIPGSSYAFEIAERIGLESDILGRARALVGEKKTAVEELIATFEARNQALQERLTDVENERDKARAEKRQYEKRRDSLRENTDAIRHQAMVEADRILQGANARIEKTIREIRETGAEPDTTREARDEVTKLKQEVLSRKEKVERRQLARKRRKKPTGVRAFHGPLSVGDQVVLDGGGTAAEILEISEKEGVVAVGSMRMRVKLTRLTKIGGPRNQRVAVRQIAQDPSGIASASARRHIDLRGKRVDEAIGEVMRLIDEALPTGIGQVEILHGKGTGALRRAIHDYLDSRDDITGYDVAPWNQGGTGVTLVNLT